MSERETGYFRLGHTVDHTEIYGPGIRSAIWLKGCTLACDGCWNKQYWPAVGGEIISVEELNARLNAIEGIEGITLLGGEPYNKLLKFLN